MNWKLTLYCLAAFVAAGGVLGVAFVLIGVAAFKADWLDQDWLDTDD